jgi:Fe-S oxidoreductase
MENLTIPELAQVVATGEMPEYLYWVGCAGSYDARAQKVAAAMAGILEMANVSYAILGNEEGCCGDPARRAGNEFLFQMLAQMNIETLNAYEVKKIVTTCPHCFNTLGNEYPELGGKYEVIHHTQLINKLLAEKKITLQGGGFEGKKLTYHDSCYLGRVNNIYEVPREVLQKLDTDFVEMERSKSTGLCCGAGGAQMFKEDEAGAKRINQERIEEALQTGANIIAVNCPFCLTMMTDGVKAMEKQDDVMVLDLAELIINNAVS